MVQIEGWYGTVMLDLALGSMLEPGDYALTGCSTSIQPPFLVRTTFWPTAERGLSRSDSSAMVPLVGARDAGHGRMVEAESETVRKAAAKVAMKNDEVASRRVRTDGFARRPHIASRRWRFSVAYE